MLKTVSLVAFLAAPLATPSLARADDSAPAKKKVKKSHKAKKAKKDAAAAGSDKPADAKPATP